MGLGPYDLFILGPGAKAAREFDGGEVKGLDPLAVVIAIDGPDTMEGAVETTGLIIYERVPRSFTAGELLSAVRRGLEARRLRMQVKELKTAGEDIHRDQFRFITTVAHELRAR